MSGSSSGNNQEHSPSGDNDDCEWIMLSEDDVVKLKKEEKKQNRKELNKIVETTWTHLSHLHLESAKKQCSFCNKRFDNVIELREHRKTHLNTLYKCSLCARKFTSKIEMTEHEENHTVKDNYTCHICGCECLTFYHLLAHEQIEHRSTFIFH